MGFRITKGGSSLTGGWLWTGWYVHGGPSRHSSFNSLKAAKAFAVQNGASGKWARSTPRNGPRQLPVTTYTEIE